jgi:signal transduction histidine kinase
MNIRGYVARPVGAVGLVIVVGTLAVGLSGLVGTTTQPLVQATAIMRALAVPAFLAAGVLRLARWRITGEGHCALRGTAMILMGGMALPSVSLARTLATPEGALTTVTFVRAVTAAVVLYVIAVALSDDDADRPALERRIGWLIAMTVGMTFLVLSLHERIPPSPAVEVLLAHGVAVALAVAWLTVAVGAVMKARHAPWARPTAALLGAMSLAELFRVPGRPETTVVAATLTAVVGFLVASSALTDLLGAAQDEHDSSLRLSQELALARDEVWTRDSWRHDLTHDARSTLAGIRAAMQTLDRHAEHLDASDAARLRVATLAELAHLEHMLVPRSTAVAAADAAGDLAAAPVFDVADVVRTVSDVRRAAGQVIDVRAHPALVQGSPGDVATILQNLLVNTQDHAPGARVSVEVGSAGALVQVTVSDDGPGIPAASGPSAFDRGFRGTASRGTGLGLSVARTSARRLGGDLELAPTATGTTFVLTLPLASSPAATPTASVPS